MAYPELVCYGEVEAFRAHFERVYCRGPLLTFDAISVRFQKRDFDHCFYESSRRDGVKDTFSRQRAERIDWIAAALKDGLADLFVGWDNKKKRYDRSRRVTLVVDDYVVIIRLTGPKRARFVTAFVADSPRTLERIKKGPKWNAKRA